MPPRRAPAPSHPVLTRPRPPVEACDLQPKGFGTFIPAPDLAAWARSIFLDETSPLYSETHADIAEARIAWLWTSEPYSSGGRERLGDAGLANPPRSTYGWDAALYRFQMETWFGTWWEGESPDFQIRIYAPYFAEADDASALALVKHELLHCRQALNSFGSPRFHRETGRPIWGIRAHPVEEFPEVVEWFGADVHDGAVAQLVRAGSRPPRAGRASIAGACGTCLQRAA